jgi:hypothetical protein
MAQFAFSPLHNYAASIVLSAIQVALENGAEVNTMAIRTSPLHFPAWPSLDAIQLLWA